MNCFRLFTITTILFAFAFTFTSCKKTETITKIEIQTDTVEVAAIDTVFAMDVANWNFFNYPGFLPSGPTTYTNTAEGIKFFPQLPRAGVRLQVKNEVGFKDKSILFKWKANGGGQFTDIVIGLKYDPTTGDGTPPIQGIDLQSYTLQNSLSGSILVQNDTWYYTRIAAQKGSDNFQVITATGGYDNNGGTQIASKSIAIYTKHGYPAIRLGDPFAGANAYCVLGECKIVEN